MREPLAWTLLYCRFAARQDGLSSRSNFRTIRALFVSVGGQLWTRWMGIIPGLCHWRVMYLLDAPCALTSSFVWQSRLFCLHGFPTLSIVLRNIYPFVYILFLTPMTLVNQYLQWSSGSQRFNCMFNVWSSLLYLRRMNSFSCLVNFFVRKWKNTRYSGPKPFIMIHA